MSYNQKEESIREGSPIELFHFVIELDHYRYTSQEEDITEGLDVYEAIPIQRSALAFQGEVNKSDIMVTMPRDEAIALQFIVQPPAVPVMLYIYRYHATDSINNKITIWSGRIIDVTWRDSKATFNCESIYTSINRYGLKRTYGPSCPYVLYDDDTCKVNKLLYVVDTTLTGLSGTTLTSPDFGTYPDDYFGGGYVELQIPAKPTEYRSILSSTGNNVTIGYSMPSLTSTSTIKAYPGCGRNLNDCTNKFSNLVNYGGFPYSPLVVPFNGTTLF